MKKLKILSFLILSRRRLLSLCNKQILSRSRQRFSLGSDIFCQFRLAALGSFKDQAITYKVRAASHARHGARRVESSIDIGHGDDDHDRRFFSSSRSPSPFSWPFGENPRPNDLMDAVTITFSSGLYHEMRSG